MLIQCFFFFFFTIFKNWFLCCIYTWGLMVSGQRVFAVFHLRLLCIVAAHVHGARD